MGGSRLLALMLFFALSSAFSEFEHLTYGRPEGMKSFFPSQCADYLSEASISTELLKEKGGALSLALQAKARIEENKLYQLAEYYPEALTMTVLRLACRANAEEALLLASQSISISLAGLDAQLAELKHAAGGFAAGRARGVLEEEEASRKALAAKDSAQAGFGGFFYGNTSKARQGTFRQAFDSLLGQESASTAVIVFKNKARSALEGLENEKALLESKAEAEIADADLAVRKADGEKVFLAPRNVFSNMLYSTPFDSTSGVAGVGTGIAADLAKAKGFLFNAKTHAKNAKSTAQEKQAGYLSLAVKQYSTALEEAREALFFAGQAFADAEAREAELEEAVAKKRVALTARVEELKNMDAYAYAYAVTLLEKQAREKNPATIGERIAYYSATISELEGLLDAVDAKAATSKKAAELRAFEESLRKAVPLAEQDGLDATQARQAVEEAAKAIASAPNAFALVQIEQSLRQALDGLLAQEIEAGRALEEDLAYVSRFEEVLSEGQKASLEAARRHFDQGVFQPSGFGQLRKLRESLSRMRQEVYATLPALLKKALESTMAVREEFGTAWLDRPVNYSATLTLENPTGISYDKPLALAVPARFAERLAGDFEVGDHSPSARLSSNSLLLDKVDEKAYFFKIHSSKTLAKTTAAKEETISISESSMRKRITISFNSKENIPVLVKNTIPADAYSVRYSNGAAHTDAALVQATRGENTFYFEYSLANPFTITTTLNTSGNALTYEFKVKNNKDFELTGIDYWKVWHSCDVESVQSQDAETKAEGSLLAARMPATLKPLEEKTIQVTVACNSLEPLAKASIARLENASTASPAVLKEYVQAKELLDKKKYGEAIITSSNALERLEQKPTAEQAAAQDKIALLQAYLEKTRAIPELSTENEKAEKVLEAARRQHAAKEFQNAATTASNALEQLKEKAKVEALKRKCRNCASLFAAGDYLAILAIKEEPAKTQESGLFAAIQAFSTSSQAFADAFYTPTELAQARSRSAAYQRGVSLRTAGERDQKTFSDNPEARSLLVASLQAKAEKLAELVEEEKNSADKAISIAEAQQKQFGDSETAQALSKAKEFFDSARYFAAGKTASSISAKVKATTQTGLVTATETQTLLGLAGVLVLAALLWMFSRKEKPQPVEIE